MNLQTAPEDFRDSLYGVYQRPNAKLLVLHDQEINQSGFFLTKKDALRVGFQESADWTEHETNFSGQNTSGYRSNKGRFIILRRTPRMMFRKYENKEWEFIGRWNHRTYDPALMTIKTRYLLYIVNQQHQLLHQHPLCFTTTGSLSGSFGDHYTQFRAEMCRSFGMTRGERFFALSVLSMKLEPRLRGKKRKSWVSSVVDHQVPQPWEQSFIGHDNELRNKLMSEFNSHADFSFI